jgi:hypothetical protein
MLRIAYTLPERLARPAGAATAYVVVGKNLPALRIVYTLLGRRISLPVIVTAYAVLQIVPSP